MSLVSNSLSPPQSLGLYLEVRVGRNQVQRKVGDYSALYFATNSNIQDAYVELDSLDVWSSNLQETIQHLVLYCSGVLNFNAVMADDSVINMPVNSMLVIDSAMKSFTLTNVSGALVRANLNFVTSRT